MLETLYNHVKIKFKANGKNNIKKSTLLENSNLNFETVVIYLLLG